LGILAARGGASLECAKPARRMRNSAQIRFAPPPRPPEQFQMAAQSKARPPRPPPPAARASSVTAACRWQSKRGNTDARRKTPGRICREPLAERCAAIARICRAAIALRAQIWRKCPLLRTPYRTKRVARESGNCGMSKNAINVGAATAARKIHLEGPPTPSEFAGRISPGRIGLIPKRT
jgi:hypothetical protein